jgi:hypothetical protein
LRWKYIQRKILTKWLKELDDSHCFWKKILSFSRDFRRMMWEIDTKSMKLKINIQHEKSQESLLNCERKKRMWRRNNVQEISVRREHFEAISFKNISCSKDRTKTENFQYFLENYSGFLWSLALYFLALFQILK